MKQAVAITTFVLLAFFAPSSKAEESTSFSLVQPSLTATKPICARLVGELVLEGEKSPLPIDCGWRVILDARPSDESPFAELIASRKLFISANETRFNSNVVGGHGLTATLRATSSPQKETNWFGALARTRFLNLVFSFGEGRNGLQLVSVRFASPNE